MSLDIGFSGSMPCKTGQMQRYLASLHSSALVSSPDHGAPAMIHPQGEEKNIVVDRDDGVREGMTPGALAKLRPVFKKSGTTTAGNSSQVTMRRCLL